MLSLLFNVAFALDSKIELMKRTQIYDKYLLIEEINNETKKKYGMENSFTRIKEDTKKENVGIIILQRDAITGKKDFEVARELDIITDSFLYLNLEPFLLGASRKALPDAIEEIDKERNIVMIIFFGHSVETLSHDRYFPELISMPAPVADEKRKIRLKEKKVYFAFNVCKFGEHYGKFVKEQIEDMFTFPEGAEIIAYAPFERVAFLFVDPVTKRLHFGSGTSPYMCVYVPFGEYRYKVVNGKLEEVGYKLLK